MAHAGFEVHKLDFKQRTLHRYANNRPHLTAFSTSTFRSAYQSSVNLAMTMLMCVNSPRLSLLTGDGAFGTLRVFKPTGQHEGQTPVDSDPY